MAVLRWSPAAPRSVSCAASGGHADHRVALSKSDEAGDAIGFFVNPLLFSLSGSLNPRRACDMDAMPLTVLTRCRTRDRGGAQVTKRKKLP